MMEQMVELHHRRLLIQKPVADTELSTLMTAGKAESLLHMK